MESHILSIIVCHWDGSYPTIPHGCLEWIVHGPPMDARRGIAWKTYTRVRWVWIISSIASWTVTTRGDFVTHVCRVVRFYPLQGVLLIRISVTSSEIGDSLLTASKCSNSTFIIVGVKYTSTTGHRLRPKISDTIGSLQRQMAGEPYTPYRLKASSHQAEEMGSWPLKKLIPGAIRIIDFTPPHAVGRWCNTPGVTIAATVYL
jgi:hypothetical protein